MHTALPILVFLVALGAPLCLLWRFHSAAWPLHVLAIAAGIGIGLIPGTPFLNSGAGAYLLGFSILVLFIWGFGGLIAMARRGGRRAA